jgi:hypothetical protein
VSGLNSDDKHAWVARVLGVVATRGKPDDGVQSDNVSPPTNSDQDGGTAPNSELRSRERLLVVNAHNAYSDYLDARDSVGDLSAIEAALRRVEEAHETWLQEIGDQGDATERDRMELLARNVELEREALDEARERLDQVSDLISALGTETEPEQRLLLQQAIREELGEITV